ncbi:MAG: thiol reductase thioredoxin, partial [Rhodocyclaceae bacterium]|nr:thiol reductase thioredoxin [Rhodocyclaceae bacterium]
ATPAQYGVRGIPTMILFKDGNVVATTVGAVPRGQLVEFINSHL